MVIRAHMVMLFIILCISIAGAPRGLPGVLPRTETVQSQGAQAPQNCTFRPGHASGPTRSSRQFCIIPNLIYLYYLIRTNNLIILHYLAYQVASTKGAFIGTPTDFDMNKLIRAMNWLSWDLTTCMPMLTLQIPEHAFGVSLRITLVPLNLCKD